jgi:hypothetical protein
MAVMAYSYTDVFLIFTSAPAAISFAAMETKFPSQARSKGFFCCQHHGTLELPEELTGAIDEYELPYIFHSIGWIFSLNLG